MWWQPSSDGSATPTVLGTDWPAHGPKVGWKALGRVVAAALVLGVLPSPTASGWAGGGASR
jgi:hypothetical protein